jgi:hypothetical protein
MNVYRVDAFAKPPNSRSPYYAHLMCRKSDEDFLSQANFSGRRFPGKWRRVRLFFDEPLRPRADFCHLGIGNFVCNERARRLCSSVLDPAGDFLPVSIEGEKEDFYIYNVTNCGPFMDPAKSVREYLDASRSVLPLVAPAFHSDAIQDQYVFKIPEDSGRTIYCVEHPEERTKPGFKMLVEQNGLTGLRFDLAWSKRRGPVPKQDPPTFPGMGWITGDGKPFRAK